MGAGIEVKERRKTAKDALIQLGVDTGYLYDDEDYDISKALAEAVGSASLPLNARERSTEHADEDVSATLGGIARALVLHGEVAGALEACSQWLGVASSKQARSEAFDAYCNLWKRHGDKLTILELSRAPPHGLRPNGAGARRGDGGGQGAAPV